MLRELESSLAYFLEKLGENAVYHVVLTPGLVTYLVKQGVIFVLDKATTS